MGAVKDPSQPMVQGKEDVQGSSVWSDEMKGSEKRLDLRDILMKQKHEEGTELSSEWSEEISRNGIGKSSPLRELLKKQKLEEEEEGCEKFHDPIDVTSAASKPPRARPITLYHLSLFKFNLSCNSPDAGASDATSSPNSLRQLIKKERARGARGSTRSQEGSDDFWWKKAMRRTKLAFRNLGFSLRRCYQSSVDCCAAGLDYRGLASTNYSTSNRRVRQRSNHRQETVERERVRDHFAPSLDSVRTARPNDCSRDQCGWSEDFSSPTQFSWESTPVYYSNSTHHQLLHQHQQHPAQSIISTITTTTTELLCYSSNLMTPYEIHHSFRRTFTVDDRKSRPDADI